MTTGVERTDETTTGDAIPGDDGVIRLVIVESPAKARTIAQYLGPGYIVESSIGHIRDLPSSAAQIPKKFKNEPWARLGVNIEQNFEPLYVVPPDKSSQVTKLRKLLKQADELYLATDEDREGEAIAWHLTEVLKPKVPVYRMVFHEITESAIAEAIANPREINEPVVRAQEARRILDRLFGYEVSPVLWKKVKPRLSAGRVQSVAVRLVVDREQERMAFVSASYWDIDADLRTRGEEPAQLHARLVELDRQRVASGRDFDAASGAMPEDSGSRLLDELAATALAERLETSTFTVTDVTERPYTQRPPAPFITSTLQQEAGRKLRYTAQRTMQVAQRLYENGYITYMRTDSTDLSQQAVNAARQQIASLYGSEYHPDQPRRYRTSTEGAQEAHEAIRPAGERFRTTESVQGELDPDATRLYDLIWKRTIASQMSDARGVRTQVRLDADGGDLGVATFHTSGKVIRFPGFLRAYVEGSDDPEAELEDQERILPQLAAGDELDATGTQASGHETQPPNRWTEASLIRELEERGIGRPSTYASILQTIQDRGYVSKKGSALVPSFVAFAVVNLLEEHFPLLVDLGFTARMEECLDEIAEGAREAKPWLSDVYFGDPDAPDPMGREGLHGTIEAGWEAIDARAISSISLGIDDEGRLVAVRVGRYGPYVQAGDDEPRADVPEDLEPDEMDLELALELLQQRSLGDRQVATWADTGEPIYLKTGRYGPYVQIGEDPEPLKGRAKKDQPKPRRSSLWPTMTMEDITAEQALQILQFPKNLGLHPETDEAVMVQDGPNGPYVKAGSESRSLEDHDHLQRVTLEEAVALLKEPRRRRGQRAQSILKELGQHPDYDSPITVREGRFGPYVTDGTVNASIPKGRDPSGVTQQDALDWLAAREERIRSEGKDPRAKKAPARRRSNSRRPRRKSRAS